MKYDYEDLSPGQFEALIVALCQKLFGIGVQGFAEGPDGGRDAKFVGTAERHPSTASPWTGTTVIQAKHTNGFNMTFGDPDFFSETGTTATLNKETSRIKKLRDAKQIDNYMLFSNRRLPANAEAKILQYIAKEVGMPLSSLYLCGTEQLEMWMKAFPDAARVASLNPIDCPLLITPDDLANIIEALSEKTVDINAILDDPPSPRISYADKNKGNKTDPVYAKLLRKRYLKDVAQIYSFLSAPENINIMRLYEASADEIEFKIVANRTAGQEFGKVMEYIADLLFARDPILSRNKRLTRSLLFYMYWNCDIGKIEQELEDVAAD